MPDLTPQSIERLRELQEVCRENADLVKRHESAKDWRDFADALAAAVAVLESVPTTTDGVTVRSGMSGFDAETGHEVTLHLSATVFNEHLNWPEDWNYNLGDQVYSSQAAKEQADA